MVARNHYIGLNLDGIMARDIEVICEARGISKAELVREAIEYYLHEYHRKERLASIVKNWSTS